MPAEQVLMPSQLTRRQILTFAAATAAVAAMPAVSAIAAVEEAPVLSERVDFAHFIRKAFLDGGGTHERFAIEFPNHAWTIACDVMSVVDRENA
jgi:hypothetical protein